MPVCVRAQLDTVKSKAGVLAIIDELEKITPLLEKVRMSWLQFCNDLLSQHVPLPKRHYGVQLQPPADIHLWGIPRPAADSTSFETYVIEFVDALFTVSRHVCEEHVTYVYFVRMVVHLFLV